MAKNDSTAGKFELDAEQLTAIRQVLLIGLASYGEIQRLQNVFELSEAGGKSVPETMRPLDPTGAAGTVGDFATALSYVEYAREVPHG
jgi:hypothetical protein